jgi:hypothetical protein
MAPDPNIFNTVTSFNLFFYFPPVCDIFSRYGMITCHNYGMTTIWQCSRVVLIMTSQYYAKIIILTSFLDSAKTSLSSSFGGLESKLVCDWNFSLESKLVWKDNQCRVCKTIAYYITTGGT